MKRLLALFTVLFMLPSAAMAAEFTGIDLVNLCRAKDVTSQKSCQFYLLGVMEGASAEALLTNDKKHFCLPHGLTMLDMEALYVSAMPTDTKKLMKDFNIPAIAVARTIFDLKYPCDKAAQ